MTSTIKVNNIQNQCGANIINESSNTITIGASGDTVSLASGASQSGFGRTGTVDWQTGSIKTATFTAVNGEGYFCNTTAGAFTVNLPSSPSAGNIVAVKDYAQTFATNNLTVGRGGSNIEGVASDITLDGNAESITLVYVDGTKGWLLINESTTQYGQEFVAATGGSVATCGDFKIHTFTGPGTFCVSSAGNAAGSNTVSYVVVAGGGSGGACGGAGGGAGGYRESKAASDCYSASPLNATSGPGYNLPVTVQAYPITVAGGGPAPGSTNKGGNGSNSVFSTITSTGGGGGSGRPGSQCAGDGGSGGGAQYDYVNTEGAGNTPPVSPPQGNPGGPKFPSTNAPAGGGGGATAAGQPSCYVNGPPTAGSGGAGATSSINGTPTARAGGGGGGAIGSSPACNSQGGTGGGGKGTTAGGCNGTTNTGGGGGGGMSGQPGGSGGSGIVIIRYKFQ